MARRKAAPARKKLNHPQRYVVGERLHEVAVDFVHIEFMLWTMAPGKHRIGLTPKERAYVEKLAEDTHALRTRVTKLHERIKDTTTIDWTGLGS